MPCCHFGECDRCVSWKLYDEQKKREKWEKSILGRLSRIFKTKEKPKPKFIIYVPEKTYNHLKGFNKW